MGKLLITLFVFISSYGYGQSMYGLDTIKILSETYPKSYYRLIASDTLYMRTRVKSNDTTKVIMLVCDTSSIVNFFDSIISAPSRSVYWIMGYEVVERNPIIYERWTSLRVSSSVIYLDDKKRQLSKSLIVWQTKNIN